MSSSGKNILAQTNTWSGAQSYNQIIQANQGVQFNSFSVMGATVQTTTVTLSGGSWVQLCDTTAGAFTLSLPASPGSGQSYFIKQINSANALTVSGNGHNIDGAASIAFTAVNEGILVMYLLANTAWYVIAQVAATIL